MSGEVGTAYVRIRPQLAGFQADTERGVKSALLGAAKIAGGLFAIEGLARTTESVVKSAADQQAELAAVRKAVENTGAAWMFQGETVAQVLQDERRLLGFSVDDLSQGFIRIESGVKNTAKTFRDLSLAEDIARARHLGLAQASVILARAAQGSDTALRRLGIIIPKQSANVDELKRRHDQAVASGVKFNAQQKSQYEGSLKAAAALDKQASTAHTLAEIENRFGGQAQRFADTTAGRLARVGENLHQFKVSLGNDLLPLVDSLSHGLSIELTAAEHSTAVHHALRDSVEGIRAVFVDAKQVVQALAPPLEAVAHAAADVARFAGLGGLVAFAAGYKAISFGVAAAAAVQARYDAVIAAGAGGQAASTAATTARSAAVTADTVAVTANTAALAANADALAAVSGLGLTTNLTRIASGYRVASVGASGLVVATREAETVSLGLGTRLGILGRGLFTLAGGWTTLAAVGIGAATFGLYKFITAETATEHANDRMRASLDALDVTLVHSAKLARDYGDAISSVKSDRVAVESAKANVELARQALTTTKAKAGTAEYASLQAQLAQALDSERVALRTLNTDQNRAAQLRHSQTAALEKDERARVLAIERTTQAARTANREVQQSIGVGGHAGAGPQVSLAARVLQQSAEFAKAVDKEAGRAHDALLRHQLEGLASFARAVGRLPGEREIRIVLQANSAREGLLELTELYERARPKQDSFVERVRLESEQLGRSNPSLAERLSLLADYSEKVGRVPTRRETELVFKAPSFQAAVDALTAALTRMVDQAGREGRAGGSAFARNFAAAETEGGLFGPFLDAATAAAKHTSDVASGAVRDSSKASRTAAAAIASAARSTARDLEAKIAEARRTARDAADSVHRSDEQVADAERGVRQATLSVADAERGVADAIQQGAQAVRDAVAQADQNLFSIGSSLADTIGQFLDARDKTEQALSGPQAAELARLRAKILAGQGGPETARAAQELANEIEVKQSKGTQDRKERIKREIADLVDEFNKGAISLETFNRRLAGILAKEGVTYKKAGQTLGVAFADGFRAEVEGLLKQAAALAAGPRRPGVTGLEPSIVRPLDALRDSQRQIASAQRARDDALYAKTIAIRNLADSENEHTKAIRDSERAQTKLADLQEKHEKATKVAAEDTRRSASLIEQHTRYLADRAKRDEAHSKPGPAGAAAAAQPGRGGADLGRSLGAGVAGGIRAEITNAEAAIEALVAAAIAAGRKKARAKSPSAETEALGYDLGRGLAVGLAGSHGPAGKAAEDLVDATLARARERARPEKFPLRLEPEPLVRRPEPLVGKGGLELLERFARETAKESNRHRELVEAVRALGRVEERRGDDQLQEERRQTEQLRRIHSEQTRPLRPHSLPRQPRGEGITRATAAASHNLEV